MTEQDKSSKEQFDRFDRENLERELIEQTSFVEAPAGPLADGAGTDQEDEDFKAQFGAGLADTTSAADHLKEHGWTPDLHEDYLDVTNPKHDFIQRLKEFRKSYSIINYSGKTFVHSVNSKGELEFQDFKSFKEFHGNEWSEWEVEDTKGKPRLKRFYVANEFLTDKFVQKYEGVEFSPENADKRFINLWKGWNLKGIAAPIPLFEDLVRALCNHDEAAYDYFMNYLAHLVQKPADKPGVAVVMRSDPGVGKGTLMKLLSRFNDNYKHLSSGKSLTGDFSGHLMDGYIIFADESVWGGNKEAEGRLKSLITEPVVSIRAMRKDEIQVRSYCRLFVASNESWAVPVGEGDRRYFVVECSTEYKGKTGKGEFFARFEEWMNKGGDEAVFHFLKHKDISKFNPRVFPKTKARAEMQKLSMSVSNKFIYELLNGTAPMADDTMTVDGLRRRFSRNKLYADLVDWCKAHNRGFSPSTDEFGKTVAKSLNFAKDNENWKTNWSKKVGGKNEYFYQVNSMAEAQERFAQAVFDCHPSDVFFNYSQHKEELDSQMK